MATTTKAQRTQEEAMKSKKKIIFPLGYQVAGTALCVVLALFVYRVFIPQISELNSIEQNTCHYVDHSVEKMISPTPGHLNEPEYLYKIQVTFENQHHQEPSSYDHLNLNKNHGVILKQDMTREKMDAMVNNLKHMDKGFPCFVKSLYPEHEIYLEKPSGSVLWHSAVFLFGLSAIAVWLLKCYVDWNELAQRSTTRSVALKPSQKSSPTTTSRTISSSSS